MTKADLVEKVAETVKLTKKDTEVVIDTIFDSISKALQADNGKVELRGFGSFRVRRRRARQGQPPDRQDRGRAAQARALFQAGQGTEGPHRQLATSRRPSHQRDPPARPAPPAAAGEKTLAAPGGRC